MSQLTCVQEEVYGDYYWGLLLVTQYEDAYPQHDLDMSTFTVTNTVLIGMNRIVGDNNNKLKAISEPIN